MSSDEFLMLLLAQQQQKQQQGAAPFSAPAPSYQQQSLGIPLPAPAAQPYGTTLPSLSELLECLQAVGSTKATNTPAPAASKSQENYEQLQRYLQASGVMYASNSSAAPATTHQSPLIPSDCGTMRAPPQNRFAPYPNQLKEDIQQPTNQSGQQNQQSQHNQVQQQHQQSHQHRVQQLINQQNLTLQQKQDSIIASLKLLAEINPDMAAVAVMQVLNMSSTSSQRQQQCYQVSHLQTQPQKQPQPQQGFDQNQVSKPPTSSLSQQQQSLPAWPGYGTTATGRPRSSATTPAPSPMHNDGNLFIPNTKIDTIKPNKGNGTVVAATGELMPPPMAPQGTKAHSTSVISSGRPAPDATSKSLDNGMYLIEEKGAANENQGKAKSEKTKSSRASKQHNKKRSLPLNRSSKESQRKKKSHHVAAASGIEQEPSAVTAATSSLPISIPTPDKTTLQSWSLELLEMHVQQLKHASQPIPQHLAVLLFNSRRKEEKRKAKRLANRKSATISRARKKAFIEDMTKDNARLRKRATLLKFLPDPVIAVNMKGEITFCGSQVEKVLKHNASELIGVNIRSIVAPNSRRTLNRLIHDLDCTAQQKDNRTVGDDIGNGHGTDESEGNNSNGLSHAHLMSRQSPGKAFPVLEINASVMQTSNGEDMSNLSTYRRSKEEKDRDRKYRNKEKIPLPLQKSSIGNEVKSQFVTTSTCHENGNLKAKKGKISSKERSESASSRKAIDRIINNVNDAKGSSVSAKNEDAKLSSFMPLPNVQTSGSRDNSDESQGPLLCRHKKHAMKQSCPWHKASEDRSLSSIVESYQSRNKITDIKAEHGDCHSRESKESSEEFYDSPEGSSTSCEGLEANKGKRSRLAQVYKVRFIRGDLTTVWCELTSSMFCTGSFFDDESSFDPKAALEAINNPRGLKSSDSSGDNNVREDEDEDEVLICIRPKYEGKKMEEEFRLTPTASTMNESEATSLSDDTTNAVPKSEKRHHLSYESSSEIMESRSDHRLNEQPFVGKQESEDEKQCSLSKKEKVGLRQSSTTGHDVHSVAESLVFMSNNTL